ncbi:unnamed protein product [Scytosiphon promiscuus]
MEDDGTSVHSSPLYLGPVRRPLSPDAEFFDEGNTNRALLCKINVFAIIARGGESDEMDVLDKQNQQRYDCMFQDCAASFSSLKRHEEHYETSHRNRCSTCGRSFPTNRLLDLHLSEQHDSFFRAMAERRPMYACLVEGCSEVFETSVERHKHLVGVHRYPERFDFSRPSYTRNNRKRDTKSKSERKRGGDVNTEVAGSDGRKEKLGAREKNSCSGSDSGVAPSVAATVEASNAPGAATRSDTDHFAGSAPVPPHTGPARKEQQHVSLRLTEPSLKAAPRLPRAHGSAAAPRKACKFWQTAAGCRAGSDCKFRHDASTRDAGDAGSNSEGGGEGGSGRDAKEWSRPGGGGVRFGGGTAGRMTRGGGVCVASHGGVVGNAVCASLGGGSAMEEEEEEDGGDDPPGSIDALVSGMSKLLIPRQVGLGSSARVG